MEEKIFCKGLCKSKKWKVLFFIISMLIIIISYALVNKQIEVKKVLGRIKENDLMILTSIEEVQVKNENIIFSGMAFHLTNENEDVYLVLQAKDSSEKLAYKVKRKQREDIKDRFNLSEKVGNIGYEVSINQNELEKDVSYEVLLDVSYFVEIQHGKIKEKRQRQIKTNYYLCNGELYVEKPTIVSKQLQSVIEKGELCYYIEEKKVWIYLYNGVMYWIMDSVLLPEFEQIPSIRIFLYSDREDLIPQRDIEKFLKEGYVYREIVIEKNHYLNDSSYCVVKFEMPTEYPIIYMRTGVYKNGEDKAWAFQSIFPMVNYENKY